MSCKSAKFTISDAKMLELLKKYPFLKMRNFWKQEPDDTFKTDAENIEHNKYKIGMVLVGKIYGKIATYQDCLKNMILGIS